MVRRLRPAVFFDRDGVLTIPEFRDGRSFAPRRLEDFRIYGGTEASLKRLKKAGFLLIVVTNQPDVGNGLIEQGAVEEMHRQLVHALPLDAVEVCYHSRADECSCRKPKPGMLLHAGEKFAVDWEKSFMVGDRGSDVVAGRAAGCRTIFLDRGYRDEDPCSPDYVVTSLAEATEKVLSGSCLTERANNGAWLLG